METSLTVKAGASARHRFLLYRANPPCQLPTTWFEKNFTKFLIHVHVRTVGLLLSANEPGSPAGSAGRFLVTKSAIRAEKCPFSNSRRQIIIDMPRFILVCPNERSS